MPHTHILDLPWLEKRSPTGKFHSFCRDISVALGSPRNVGLWGGGHPFDLQIRRIPPGASVCPFHSHLAQWEFFLVQHGTGTVRTNSGTHTVRTGDFFIHPPGEPHQLSNPGTIELEVLIIADNPEIDGFHYPDSNKWGLRRPPFYFRATEVDYFDGEDLVVDEPKARALAPEFPTAISADFTSRKRNVDELPWELWQSTKGKFRGYSRELSIALGAKRNTPAGLGGHPFDVELGRFAPGECGNPFHSHAAQWELFLILSGQATVRLGDERHRAGPGDVWLHPPREAHQIANASTSEDLLFLIVADNPAVDYWYYPDSKKWGLREPRMFFRPEPVDYYDGEE